MQEPHAFRDRGREDRPVEQRQGRASIRGLHRLGKEHGILIHLPTQINAVVRGEAHQPQAASVRQVAGDGGGDARACRPEGRVGHHVEAMGGDVGDPRVLHAAARIRIELVRSVRLQHHA